MKRRIQDSTSAGLRSFASAWKALGNPPYPFQLPKREALPPVMVRQYAAADYSACCEIYQLNAPGRFPEGIFDEFAELLASEKLLFLVLEKEKRIVGLGCVSLYRTPGEEGAVLSFGMIHPDFHRCGLGTVLLLSRIAVLPVANDWYALRMYPIPASEYFYRRFGFQHDPKIPVKPEDMAVALVVFITTKDIVLCRNILARSSVALKVRRDVLMSV